MEGKTGKRRFYSRELKAEVVAACSAPGALISAVARSRGLSANMIRRWIAEDRDARPAATSPQPPTPAAAAQFVPVQIEAVDGDIGPPVIRVEVHRGPTKIDIAWPTTAAGECAAWLREWLK